jgi:hypothetical protein
MRAGSRKYPLEAFELMRERSEGRAELNGISALSVCFAFAFVRIPVGTRMRRRMERTRMAMLPWLSTSLHLLLLLLRSLRIQTTSRLTTWMTTTRRQRGLVCSRLPA